MIVRRLIYKAKLGHVHDLVNLLKTELDQYPTHTYRLYTSLDGGPSERVIFEMQYANRADLEKSLAEWNALPTTPAVIKKLHELVENQTSTEVLTVQWEHIGKP
jgi:hypothetical protein